MAGIVLEGVSRVFARGVVALQAVDLEVRDSELLVILGPSGCGKTTALRVIAGLDAPSAGKVWFDCEAANRLPPGRRGVAMVFQDASLYPHLSVGRHLQEVVGARGAATARSAALAAQLVAELGVERLWDRLPHELSGGERQRVALARALLKPSRVVLLDEPLAGMDAPLRRQQRRIIRTWQQLTKSTVVYVTHDQEEALAVADRVAVLMGGRIQQISPPTDLYRHPATAFVASFVGQPPMNLLHGRANAAARWTADEPWKLELPLPTGAAREPGLRLTAGVRPECLRIGPAEPFPDGVALAATVGVREFQGDTVLVGIGPERAPVGPIVLAWVKAPATAPTPQVGEKATVWVRLHDLQWFDGETGRALGASETQPPAGRGCVPPGSVD